MADHPASGIHESDRHTETTTDNAANTDAGSSYNSMAQPEATDRLESPSPSPSRSSRLDSQPSLSEYYVDLPRGFFSSTAFCGVTLTRDGPGGSEAQHQHQHRLLRTEGALEAEKTTGATTATGGRRRLHSGGGGGGGQWEEEFERDRVRVRDRGLVHGTKRRYQGLLEAGVETLNLNLNPNPNPSPNLDPDSKTEMVINADMDADRNLDWKMKMDMGMDMDVEDSQDLNNMVDSNSNLNFNFGFLDWSNTVRKVAVPQTMAFHLDWWLARLATKAINIDLKTLLANMMLWREKNNIDPIPTSHTMAGPRLRLLSMSTLGSGMEYNDDDKNNNDNNNKKARLRPASSHQQQQQQQPPGLLAVNGLSLANALRNDDGSFASTTGWDVLLQQVRQTSRIVRDTRCWRMRGLKNAAGWCRWQRREWLKTEGEFVSDLEGGFFLTRTLDEKERDATGDGKTKRHGHKDADGDGNQNGNGNEDENKVRVWKINLGYRRKRHLPYLDGMDCACADDDHDPEGDVDEDPGRS